MKIVWCSMDKKDVPLTECDSCAVIFCDFTRGDVAVKEESK